MESDRFGPEFVEPGPPEPVPVDARSKHGPGSGFGKGGIALVILVCVLGLLAAGIAYAAAVSDDSSNVTADLPPSATEPALSEFDPVEFCDGPAPQDDALPYSPKGTNPIRVARPSSEVSSEDWPLAWWENTPALVACAEYGDEEVVQDCGTYTEVVGLDSLPVSETVEVTLYREPLNVRLYEVRTAELLDETALQVDPECPQRVRAVEGASDISVTERPESRALFNYLEDYVFAGR